MLDQIILRRTQIGFIAVVAVLLAAYLPTLQTIPNGSEHYTMIDVGETQIVLNVWGTLHATGYPLYVMLGGALVAILRALGVNPAAAPAVVSLIWGIAALGLLYALAARLTRRPLLAAGMIVLLGLTRTVWIHHDIAEIYTFGLLISAGLLVLALWQPPIRYRLYGLALLGGIGVAHHRAIAMMIPALVYAVYPDLRAQGRRLPRALVTCLLLGVIGFAQYAYLPLRANAGAAWVYGEPGTLAGLWDQFTGREAARFIGAPATLDGLWANIGQINDVLLTDLTLPGILAGLAGLALGMARKDRRHLAITMALYGGVAYAFHCLFYTDILSALILPVLVSIGFGWLLLAERVVEIGERTRHASSLQMSGGDKTDAKNGVPTLLIAILGLALGIALYTRNQPFIHSLTSDPTGEQTIALARETPPGSALMLAWGPRYFAVGFARDVLGELPQLTLVDHKADFSALAAHMSIVTPEYTFYRQPVAWWEEQLARPVYLHAVAPHLVAIATTPELGEGDAFGARATSITCDQDQIILNVAWYTPDVPPRDLSVFVHLLDADGTLIAQGDQAAPVYGWRPLTSWQAGEIVRDVYPLPPMPEATQVTYGLYTQRNDGTFENVVEYSLPVECAP